MCRRAVLSALGPALFPVTLPPMSASTLFVVSPNTVLHLVTHILHLRGRLVNRWRTQQTGPPQTGLRRAGHTIKNGVVT